MPSLNFLLFLPDSSVPRAGSGHLFVECRGHDDILNPFCVSASPDGGVLECSRRTPRERLSSC